MSGAQRWFLPLAIAIAALGGCSHERPPTAREFIVGPVRWGEPANGLQAGLAEKRLAPESRRSTDIDLEPTVYVEFRLRNVSDRAIHLLEPWSGCEGPLPGRPLVDAAFVTATGEAYRYGYVGASDRLLVLAPGETWTLTGQLDPFIQPWMWGLTPPLDGTCVLSYHNHRSTALAREPGAATRPAEVTDLWTGDITSGSLPVRFERSFWLDANLDQDPSR